MRTSQTINKNATILASYICPHCKSSYSNKSKAEVCKKKCEYVESFDSILDKHKKILNTLKTKISPQDCFNVLDTVLRDFAPIKESFNHGIQLTLHKKWYNEFNKWDDLILKRLNLYDLFYSFSFVIPNDSFNHSVWKEFYKYKEDGETVDKTHLWIKNLLVFKNSINDSISLTFESKDYDENHAELVIFVQPKNVISSYEKKEIIKDLAKNYQEFNNNSFEILMGDRYSVFKKHWDEKDSVFEEQSLVFKTAKEDLKNKETELKLKLKEIQEQLDQCLGDIKQNDKDTINLVENRLVIINNKVDAEIKEWKFEDYSNPRTKIIKDTLSKHISFTNKDELVKESQNISKELNNYEFLQVSPKSSHHSIGWEEEKVVIFTELGQLNGFVKNAKLGKLSQFLKILNPIYGSFNEIKRMTNE